MHAVTIVDGHLEWREHPDPEPGTGEVLVRVRAAGLNGADRLQVAGLYPPPPGAPVDIPGLELAGEVLALGPGANRFAVGDRVMAVVAGGGQAQRAVVNERHLLPIPDGIGWVEAGGFAEVFTTAHDALFTQAHLSLGERVCVHGAAGGVGTAGVQLAVAAGASVVATVRNPERHDDVASLGATVVDPDDFAAHGPFDVVLELVGAPNLPADVAALATGGRIAVIGVGAGAKAELNLLALMGARGSICGSTLRARSLEDKADAARRVERHVLGLLADRTVQVPIAATYAMTDAAAAYERFAAGNKFGKIILEDPT
ncbi:MAG: zinc-binding dehydrogenase [Acidimicrobiales bacterium]|nr:zinc-binding dehydrogenase [Acidimicrobiales bacterium]MCB1250567.1 zinc-binding dehydrogenase [Acidimicrobiales bacterium]